MGRVFVNGVEQEMAGQTEQPPTQQSPRNAFTKCPCRFCARESGHGDANPFRSTWSFDWVPGDGSVWSIRLDGTAIREVFACGADGEVKSWGLKVGLDAFMKRAHELFGDDLFEAIEEACAENAKAMNEREGL